MVNSQRRFIAMSTMNYYVVLGVTEEADGDTIRSAFRALARRFHPDAGAGSSAVEFRRAVEAYETLSDPDRRQRYDQQLRPRHTVIPEPMVSADFGVEPLFRSRPVSFGFPTSQMRVAKSIPFDEMFDELFTSMSSHWFWRLRWR